MTVIKTDSEVCLFTSFYITGRKFLNPDSIFCGNKETEQIDTVLTFSVGSLNLIQTAYKAPNSSSLQGYYGN